MSEKLREVEKNDVDISELFKWNKQVEVEDNVSGLKATLYMRLLGDSDLGRARAYAYRKSSELRKKLKTQDSDERVSLLVELEDFGKNKEIIINAILILRTQDLYQEAMKNITIPEPKEPDKEDLEAWEKYQQEVDSYPDRYREEVTKEADKLRKLDLDGLEKLSVEDAYKLYEGEVINKLCQEEMNNAFYDMTIFLASFKDKEFKTPVFKNMEVYNSSHKNLKLKLKEEYRKLELGIETLKKLQEATD